MRKKLNVIIALMIIFVSLNSVKSTAEDSSIKDLKEQRQILQDKISENTLQLDELQEEISDLMLEIQDLSDKIYRHEVEVAVLEKEIFELNEKIAEIQAHYNNVEALYRKRKELLANRIIAQYESGDIYYLDLLLNSKDLVDFISNYYMVGEIIDYDNELLKTCERQKEEIENIKKELDKYKSELKRKKDDQEKSAIVLSNVKVIKNNQMNRLTAEERELQRQMDEYEAESRKIEVELLMILTANLSEDYVGGVLAWPVPGYTNITSNFGMRVHPISKVYKMHTGLDVAAPDGAIFIAANDGVVVKSVYNASYGNMVVIDHGGGLSTLYAHGRMRLVEEGDTVERGQPVLLVGSTGISTGPHAHFEVRVNGMWTDPLDYILSRNSSIKEEYIDENNEENNNNEDSNTEEE